MKHIPLNNVFSFTKLTEDSNKIDLLIYTPHAELYQKGSIADYYFPILSSLNQQALEQFCYLDADIGSRKLAYSLGKKLTESKMSVAILDIHIPRSIIDFNRIFQRASSPLFYTQSFQSIFEDLQKELDQYFKMSRHSLHLHTMASHERTELWEPENTKDFTHKRVQDYSKNAYRGTNRQLNILSGDKAGNEYVDSQLTYSLQSSLQNFGYSVVKNESYSLESGYPTTESLKLYPGSAIDIPKKYLATPETKESYNPSEIIIDLKEIEKMSNVLAGVYGDYLKEK